MKKTLISMVAAATTLFGASTMAASVMTDDQMDNIVAGTVFDVYVNNGGQLALYAQGEEPKGKRWELFAEGLDCGDGTVGATCSTGDAGSFTGYSDTRTNDDPKTFYFDGAEWDDDFVAVPPPAI